MLFITMELLTIDTSKNIGSSKKSPHIHFYLQHADSADMHRFKSININMYHLTVVYQHCIL